MDEEVKSDVGQHGEGLGISTPQGYMNALVKKHGVMYGQFVQAAAKSKAVILDLQERAEEPEIHQRTMEASNRLQVLWKLFEVLNNSSGLTEDQAMQDADHLLKLASDEVQQKMKAEGGSA